MMSRLEMRGTSKGARLRNICGWPGWTIEVDIDWRTGHVREVRDIPPPGARSDARRPRDDLDLVARVKKAAEMRHGWMDFVAAALPSPHNKHGARQRAATITIMYGLAVDQGLSPRRAISAVYGLPVVDKPGERTLYSRKLERWIEQARKTTNPATGQPYLPEYDHQRDVPRWWPGRSGQYPLEPRRAQSMVPEPKREGPHSGRTLTLHYRPIPPWGVNVARKEVADVEIIGRWSDGKPVDDHIEPLRAVTLAEAVTKHLLRLNAEFEAKYPGARVQASSAAPELPHPATS